MKATADQWWSARAVPEGHRGRWQIGPLRLTVGHQAKEWRIHHENQGDPLDASLSFEPCAGALEPGADAIVTRYAIAHASDDVRLAPTLADRAIVSRPESPFLIVGGETVTVYVGTPLWIRVQLNGGKTELADIATLHLSDTWFGPNTRTGELCYAVRSLARLHLDNLPVRPARAITPVRIENQAKSALLIDRVLLPLPNLALFVAPSGRFWTQPLTLVRDEDEDLGEVRMVREPPADEPEAVQIAEPRRPADELRLLKTLSTMLA